MKKEVYLYFNEGNGGDATGDAVCYPVRRFLGVTAESTTACKLSFEALTGNAADDVVELANYGTTVSSTPFKTECEALANIMNADKGGMQVVMDDDNDLEHEMLRRMIGPITGCTITLYT